MPFKPVGVDENNQFPTRIKNALAETFVTKPNGIKHGEVPIWDANLNTWVSGSSEWSTQTKIDGGTPG
jgi:hypothetical protein